MTEAVAEPGIVVDHVRRTFGPVVAIDDMSFNAPAGQVTALVGPNGAGKTTLLLVLATLLVPDAGRVSVGGHDPVSQPHSVRAAMGWMPDSFGSYESLTSLEVLTFVANAFELPKADVKSRPHALLELVHLSEFGDRPVHVLSKGQKQRLGLARALMNDPSVLLLDEPAAGLDPRSRIELRAILRDLAARGKTLLVSSHILSELEEMADQVVFVDKGRTVSQTAISALPQSSAGLSRQWRVHALDNTGLAAALDRRGLPHSAPHAGGIDLVIDGDAEAADLVEALVREGVRLVSFAPTGSSLEAAYLAVTQERR